MLWITILRERPWTFTVKDSLYWAAVLGMIAARHFDVTRFGGRTTDGETATPQLVRRYAMILLASAALAWAVAQALHI